jgi:hypothetical protein
VSHLTCCKCGIRNEGVGKYWGAPEHEPGEGYEDYQRRLTAWERADAPRARCWDRDRCADRQREQDGLSPFLITCGACGARIPRSQAHREHQHVGGSVNTITRYFCGPGVGHRREEVAVR